MFISFLLDVFLLYRKEVHPTITIVSNDRHLSIGVDLSTKSGSVNPFSQENEGLDLDEVFVFFVCSMYSFSSYFLSFLSLSLSLS